ncbi:PAS domain-containing protein [Labilithrix luteola]|uniref:PAS domain-containing protein n=1 Tax=Labilithrix luteola TaxID=1391654 RepID=UPI000A4A15F8|nr:PAS domain-containing protein [Labilithrix luteola]
MSRSQTRGERTEELLERLLEVAPGGVAHVGRDGRFRSVNAEALRLLGEDFDAVRESSFSGLLGDVVDEDGAPSEFPSRVFETGIPQGPVMGSIRRPDGEVAWLVARAEPLFDNDGGVESALLTFVDITARKRAEEDLRRSEQKWQGLAENLPDFVLMVDRDARILSINRTLPGLTETDIVGQSAMDFLEPSGREEYLRRFAEAVTTGQSVTFEMRARGEDGDWTWFETRVVPFDENGRVERLLVVARDMTEQRAMLASLAEKERLASVGMIAAGVAHEIMNPLTYVLANLEFISNERNLDPTRTQAALHAALEGARRMRQIVWDLRSLGRTGVEELFYVDARSVFETALRLAGPEVHRSANVVVEMGELPAVLASESRLCQVFVNLLVNAAQSIEKDREAFEGKKREIRISTKHDGKRFVGISVQDTGEGIEPALLKRIFEPFYTTKRTGTGLGLSISREIIERMNGRIEVESQRGVGTTFTVWLATMRAPSSVSLRAVAAAQELPED